jgi:hypothetical protein
MNFENWVAELEERQVRALASQAGFAGWLTYPMEQLRKLLRGSTEAESIFEKNYGSK